LHQESLSTLKFNFMSVLCDQCVGSGCGRIRYYLQDPDPQFKYRINIRKGSGMRILGFRIRIRIGSAFLETLDRDQHFKCKSG